MFDNPLMQTILGFGASTMQGVGDPQGGFLRRITMHYESTGGDVRVVNQGIGGNTTRDMLARVAEVESFRPYSVVVALGCNDFPRARDPEPAKRCGIEEYAANVRQLLSAVRGERSLFITSFLVSEERTGVSSRLFADYMAEALGAATEEGYDIWDLYEETKSDVDRYWAEDGLHFGAAGHDMLARWLWWWVEDGKPGTAN